MFEFLMRLDTWFDSHFDKIWVIVSIASIILLVLGVVLNNEMICGVGEDCLDFYDEILCD